MGVSCSCPEALGPPGYCRERGVSHRPRAQAELLSQPQIQALTLGLPGEAGGLGEAGGQRGTGNGGGIDDHRQFVGRW